jgi:hypothetical protein
MAELRKETRERSHSSAGNRDDVDTHSAPLSIGAAIPAMRGVVRLAVTFLLWRS